MKKLTLLLAVALALVSKGLAAELSEADQKWATAVEKMIEKGTEKISTPDSNRADLAVKLGKKYNRTGTIQKNDKGFTVVFNSSSGGNTVAKNDK